MKLHLGCGGTYLEDYINVDFPVSDKTIMDVKADLYQDISTLDYQDKTVDEIRHHHVFEHFNRVDSLKLLLKWRKWLKVGGKLDIETPDYFWSSLLFIFAPHKYKMELGRHIFGTQEDFWGNHLDFWYKGKFKKVLSLLGFEKIKFRRPIYRNLLPNIRVQCIKGQKIVDNKTVLQEILSWYILKQEDKDKYLKNWLS
ncbi:MAG: hypothetical protein COU29_04135 [Candidatus Magasanikbacteria bacterium CG10_big_fil_rev_8_21_14_0_10_36_32]|uniref:Methyltransferase type 11 domain-containing protein n=1 Tax=Candidatus Magasanikbacteria bacterium CG10_big_fil_rev_8_21_14_0_10_36_32 TaxID=1974646 RepID=A0A2M6W5U9_9BACT|nr:MAG: hypothetical protein COU29_04135 [Candidatus Magasanikbacteria bacterium CG10_big_fil_rev_8_21_14_0_10_36_32]